MIYLFLANGFEEIEALTAVDCLRRAGCDVKTVGIGGTVITGTHGIPVTADLTEADVKLDDALEMAVLPGGMPGTRNLAASQTVQNTLHYCAENSRLLAAICAAPSVLGQMGLLKGKRATCFAGYEQALTGAEFVNLPAVSDGNVITGRSAGTALDFALLLVERLKGAETAKQISDALLR